MRALDLIVKKRNGEKLSGQEIQFLVTDYRAGLIPDYQMSAFLMAVYFSGMDREETARLTESMLASGRTLDLSGVPGPKIDKHSTGGVGDKISLILAPMVAACGVVVPMMSGRGLGHTGGTVDKLESIPGFRADLTDDLIGSILHQTGFVFMSQTEEIAPADKKLYALRDVTGTVESVPLITASILSKKAAEGADGFVFDVKAGCGAFMKTREEALLLATSLAGTARLLGKKVRTIVTAMDEPLGRMIGNLLEVEEAVRCLLGEMPPDIAALTYALGAAMLELAGITGNAGEGEALCRRAIADKRAYKLFLETIRLQGGDAGSIADPGSIKVDAEKTAVRAARDGVVQRIDAYKIGLASMRLGAGRLVKESPLIPEAGIEILKKRGDRVTKGDELCLLYTRKGQPADEARSFAADAYAIGQTEVPVQEMILADSGETA